MAFVVRWGRDVTGVNDVAGVEHVSINRKLRVQLRVQLREAGGAGEGAPFDVLSSGHASGRWGGAPYHQYPGVPSTSNQLRKCVR